MKTQIDNFQRNLSVISRRWPAIAKQLHKIDIDTIDAQWLEGQSDTVVFDGIQVSSNYNATLEAQIQSQQVDSNEKIVHLYGIGLGNVAINLLNHSALEQLNVTVLNMALFAFTLHYVKQSVWLNDPRVCLALGDESDQVKFPFIALPAELVLADDGCALLRDRVCVELDNQFIAQSNNANADKVKIAIDSNAALLAGDGDIIDLLQLPTLKSRLADESTLFVIAATGPTLSDHYQWLKAQQKGGKIILIALDASVKPLQKANIVPDIIVSIDQIADQLFNEVDQTLLDNTPLVYFPLLATTFLQQWSGPRFASYSYSVDFDYIEQYSKKTRLFSAGSVIHPAIDLAVKLSAKQVLLLGADFSLIRNKTHANDTEILTERALLSAKDTPHWLLNGHHKKVPTYLNFRGYLRDLETYIEQHQQTIFFTGSLDGAKIIAAPLWPAFAEKSGVTDDV